MDEVHDVIEGEGYAAGHIDAMGDQYGFRKSHAPRAAPWFLYWPYEAYFTYPAPTGVAFPPSYMSPNGFQPHMYDQSHFAPYPTNGYGQ